MTGGEEEPDGAETVGAAGSSEYHRPPLQERSRRTLERIVASAMEIIADEGVEAATVSAVVEKAGSSVGSFYARFHGKDDLLRYLEERVWEEARRRWTEAVSSQPWEDLELEGVVTSVVRLLVRIHEEDAGTRKALGRRAAGLGLGGEARRFHALLEEEVGGLLLRHADTIRHPNPPVAVRIAYRWAAGGIPELLRTQEREEGAGTAPGDDDTGGSASTVLDELGVQGIVDEVTRGLLAYLTGGVDPGIDEGDVEFFDVWQ